MSNTATPTLRNTLRATVVTVIALSATVAIWRLRPSAPSVGAVPADDVALGCAWLAWALLGYLSVAVAATSLRHVIAAVGVDANRLTRLAPERLSRLVDLAITLSVAAAVVGGSGVGPAGAVTRQFVSGARVPGPASSGALDWPGLADPPPRTAPPPGAAPPPRTAQPLPARHHRAKVGLVSGGAGSTTAPPETGNANVVVQAGDSLWTIAARHLGPGATAESTAIAWHQWYAANRHVVGDNPDLIYPGQRLRPPTSAALHNASTR